jgi:hypothetical protein
MRGKELKGRGGNHPRQIQKTEAKDRRAGTKQNDGGGDQPDCCPFYAYYLTNGPLVSEEFGVALGHPRRKDCGPMMVRLYNLPISGGVNKH